MLDPGRRYVHHSSMRDDGTMVHTIAYADRPLDGARCQHVSMIPPHEGFESGLPGVFHRKAVERYRCRKDAVRRNADGAALCREHLG